MTQQRVYVCGHCGHEHPADDELASLRFKWGGNLTSRIGCAGCGCYTIQQAFDNKFMGGSFLIVRPTTLKKRNEVIKK